MNLSKNDLNLLKKKGIELSQIEEQLKMFRKGFPRVKIISNASVGNGIKKMSDNEINDFISYYESADNLKIVKFVPASGAATRMFKDLFEFLKSNNTETPYIKTFIDNIKNFAFYDELKEKINSRGENIDDLIKNKDYKKIIDFVINEEGLGYGKLPKALILFHKFEGKAITAIEDHLIEGANHAKDRNGNVFIHFTVSVEHKDKFKNLLNAVVPFYEKEFNVKYNIEFSVQNESTDTIAVDLNNEPFRTDDNALLFRPGGHGALLENLNNIDADLIFIKNIDNICSVQYKDITYTYKKALAGYLLKLKEKIYFYLEKLLENKANKNLIEEIFDFINNELSVVAPENIKNDSSDLKISYCISKLNRPIRVCGMVRNDGDTGGGPFWVKNNDGSVSLQILETSQIDLNNPEQKSIFKKSTHFNPVDIVCTIKSYNGEKFKLADFRDPETGFISQKSYNGRPLKALELPGLWNGSMSNWTTVFVETPLITFNPVKSVNDLLLKPHQ
jgi:hypothetical protein